MNLTSFDKLNEGDMTNVLYSLLKETCMPIIPTSINDLVFQAGKYLLILIFWAFRFILLILLNPKKGEDYVVNRDATANVKLCDAITELQIIDEDSKTREKTKGAYQILEELIRFLNSISNHSTKNKWNAEKLSYLFSNIVYE